MITDIRPQCLLPTCNESNFLPTKLGTCPIPKCFEIVNIDGSVIDGNPKINQNANCSKYNITGNGGKGDDDFEIYLIVAVIVVIIIIIILTVALFLF